MTQRRGAPASQAGLMDAAVETESAVDMAEVFYRLLDLAKYILASAVLGAVLSLLFARFLIPAQYTATSKLYALRLPASAPSLSDLQAGSFLASDFKEVFLSRALHQRVMDRLGLSYTYDQVQDMLHVSVPADTRVLYVSVAAPSPQEAQLLANEYALAAREFIADASQALEPELFEEAWLPSSPSSPRLALCAALGFLLGGLIALVAAMAHILRDDRLRWARDIQAWAGLPTLGVLPGPGVWQRREREGNP